MQTLILFDSIHNKTKQAAEKASLILSTNVIHVKENPSLENVDAVLFLCPTYGDEELPENMENYIFNLQTKSKLFAVCELGNYYGFDDYEFGAGKIIKNILNSLHWTEIYPMLSLDSLPITHWPSFETWCKNVANEFSKRM